MFNLENHPHRRYNPLTGDWVLVSPHRAKRPWQGQLEEVVAESKPEYDEKCYLCPTNIRVGGAMNPDYQDTFVFTNDFSALLQDSQEGSINENELLVAKSEKGICRVICFSPKHNLTIPDMDVEAIVQVVGLWQKEYRDLGQAEFINYVQIFENKGTVMGASNPHPHGQIWAEQTIPDEPAKEDRKQKAYFDKNNQSLLLDYLEKELVENQRIVVANDSFVALVPFWAVWPFETMIISRRHIPNILDFTKKEKEDFAKIYKKLTQKYDKLFGVSFPYSAGIHQEPSDNQNRYWWHFHMHFYPPLLRSASIKKFMVGYEMLANPQRDISAETSARMLKDL